ncbi:hypothetical protein BN2127_JRS10_04801 [Bacillus subtilis]|nr:hypothetical protein BN2127_JRS10_04801 [Bacillus subtilis]
MKKLKLQFIAASICLTVLIISCFIEYLEDSQFNVVRFMVYMFLLVICILRIFTIKINKD